MGYSLNECDVRVDRFRVSNFKWYDSWAVCMRPYYDDLLVNYAVFKSIQDKVGISDAFIYVVLEPYHRNSFPVIIDGRKKEVFEAEIKAAEYWVD